MSCNYALKCGKETKPLVPPKLLRRFILRPVSRQPPHDELHLPLLGKILHKLQSLFRRLGPMMEKRQLHLPLLIAQQEISNRYGINSPRKRHRTPTRKISKKLNHLISPHYYKKFRLYTKLAQLVSTVVFSEYIFLWNKKLTSVSIVGKNRTNQI